MRRWPTIATADPGPSTCWRVVVATFAVVAAAVVAAAAAAVAVASAVDELNLTGCRSCSACCRLYQIQMVDR